MGKHNHLIFNKHPTMISYKKIFKQFGYVQFVLPNYNLIITGPAVLYGCRMFIVEKVGQKVEFYESESRHDGVPVNGYNGCDNYLTVSKQTYNKLWRNIII